MSDESSKMISSSEGYRLTVSASKSNAFFAKEDFRRPSFANFNFWVFSDFDFAKDVLARTDVDVFGTTSIDAFNFFLSEVIV